jgi:hypothetical protein
MQTPLAIQLYEECVRGKTPARLSAETGIPLERVGVRIFAAMSYFRNHVNEVSMIRFGGQQTVLGITDRTATGTQTATMIWSIDL